jgi:type IV pilus assembly protein PilV
MNKVDQQSGFTMIEMMIAMFILMVGFLGVITVLWCSAKSGSFSRNMTTAANLNQDMMERFSNLKYNDLPVTAGFVNYTCSNPAATGFRRLKQVEENAAGTMKTISVKILWKESGSPKTRTFTVKKRVDF